MNNKDPQINRQMYIIESIVRSHKEILIVDHNNIHP